MAAAPLALPLRVRSPDTLGWAGTFDAGCIALTQLHANAPVTFDWQLTDAVKDLVTVAPIEAPY